jgi:hypothetical protein
MDRLEDQRLVNLVGGAPREPARGSIRAEPGQGGKGNSDAALRLLPWIHQRPGHHTSFPIDSDLECRVCQAMGHERRRPRPPRRDQRSEETRWGVVLGGHSLGGSVVTAYAAWDFNGKAGADALAGLVYFDGGSAPSSVSADQATQTLEALDVPTVSPWLAFGGITAPYAGIFSATGSLAALLHPNQPSLGQASGLLPSEIVPPVRVNNVGQYGYALNASTPPLSLLAAQAHLGQGLTASGPIRGWNGAGALTPIGRFAPMFSGYPMKSVDGTEWYSSAAHRRQRRSRQRECKSGAGCARRRRHHGPRATEEFVDLCLRCPSRWRPRAGRSLAPGRAVTVPQGNLTLVNRQSTYSHNDPAGAYPNNVFFAHLVPFLNKISSHG